MALKAAKEVGWRLILPEIRKIVREEIEGMNKHVDDLRAALGDIRSAVDDLRTVTSERFNAVDSQFKAVYERFNGVDGQFKAVYERLDAIKEKVDVSRELATLQAKVRELEARR